MRLDLQCHCGAVGRSGTGGGAHFPKTAKEELEQGFNALVVVESRLPTRTKSCQIMSNKYELICVLVCLFVRVGSRNSTTTNTLNPFSSSSFAVMGKFVPLPVPLRPTSHFPKTAKEELEQGFNALVVVELRLPTGTKSFQIMSKNYEIICLHQVLA